MIIIRFDGGDKITLPETKKNLEIISTIDKNDFICNSFITFDGHNCHNRVVNVNKIISIDISKGES